MNNTVVSMNIALCAFLLLPVIVTAGLAGVPWVTDRHEVFGVTVPAAAHVNTRIRGFKVAFSGITVALGVCAILVSLAVWQLCGVDAAFWTVSIAAVAIAICGFVLQQMFRRKVLSIKVDQGWEASSARRAALIGERDNPDPMSLKWELLQVVCLAVTIAVGLLGYDRMPERVPIHADIAGNVNGWAEKSPMVIWYAVLAQVVLAAVMVASHAAIIYAKHPIDPDHPAATGYAYGVFSRVWSIYVLVIGLLAAGGSGLGVQLVTIGVLDINLIGIIGMFIAVAALVGALMIGVYYGQNGARVYAGVRHSDGGDISDDNAMPYDDDLHWIGGIIYINRDDPAIMIPKRFGVGWTVNLARPSVIIGTIVLLAIAIGLPVAAILM